MATLAEIRAKLQAQQDQKSNNYSGDKLVFPHWNIKEGESCKLRFLPDSDESNTFFWIERLLINLSFAGIKGDANSKPCTVKVPCMEMWEPVGSCCCCLELKLCVLTQGGASSIALLDINNHLSISATVVTNYLFNYLSLSS